MNQKLQSKKQSPIFVIILGALTAIGALSIDMFYRDYQKLKMTSIQQRQMHNSHYHYL